MDCRAEDTTEKGINVRETQCDSTILSLHDREGLLVFNLNDREEPLLN